MRNIHPAAAQAHRKQAFLEIKIAFLPRKFSHGEMWLLWQASDPVLSFDHRIGAPLALTQSRDLPLPRSCMRPAVRLQGLLLTHPAPISPSTSSPQCSETPITPGADEI